MKRKAQVWYGEEWSDGETGGREVFEREDAFQPKPTGVLDASGRMIFRDPERIGFRLKK